MIEPDFAINFINISTQVISTILGFSLILFIFWWNNIGKSIKFEMGTTKYTISFSRLFYKVENKFKRISKKFKKMFSIEIINILNLLFFDRFIILYNFVFNNIRNFKYVYKYKQINYKKLIYLYFIFILVIFAVIILLHNVTLLYTITRLTAVQLSNDPTFRPILDQSKNYFEIYLILFFLYIVLIILETFGIDKKENKLVQTKIDEVNINSEKK